MKDTLQAYRQVSYDLPDRIQTWHLYGAGLESFGKDKKPVELPMPEYGPDQLLVRIDAVGVCFSDIKVVNQGNKHPRITGRDLHNDPVTLGHEAAVTVVGVGDQLKDQFRIGERFIVQADVFYQGKSIAFGYVLAGAQTQYQVIGKEMLAGDEGCYLLPMQEETGYAEAALAEPWACVVASYRITHRPHVKPGGVLWLIGSPGDDGDYLLDLDVDPSLIVATDLDWPIMDQLTFWEEAGRFKIEKTEALESIDLSELEAQFGAFDDIIIIGTNTNSPKRVEKAAQLLAKDGVLNVVAQNPLGGPVKIDIGKVHYQNHAYIGTTSSHIGEAYTPVRMPSELRPGGTAWFIGAGGPMGQMHVQRAVEMENGPRKVLATDIDTPRLNSVKERFGPLAERRGAELHTVNPNEMDSSDYENLLKEFTEGKGFDDIVVLAPVAALIEQSAPHLAEQGLMNVFAGVPIGTIVSMDLTGVYTNQTRFVGSSGSKISDMKDTLEAAESGQLSTNTSVAAIGGIDASWDAMLAVKEGRFPGKIVIYPQICGLELTPVDELKDRLPNVYAKLTDGMFWNREAEEELLRSMLNIG